MALTSNTQLVSPATGGRNLQLTPNATADNAVVSGTLYISSVLFDNSNNSSAAYLKLFDSSGPTVGTSAPDWIFKANGGEKLYVNFSRNRPKFTTALSLCCVTAAGTAGSTSPTSSVSVGITTQTTDDAT